MSPETAQLRSDVAGLADSANADLAAVWREVSTAVAAQEALFRFLPHVVQQYGAAAATAAAVWYDDLRSKRGVPGRFTAAPVSTNNLGADALVGWASDTAANVVQDGQVTTEFQSLVAGGMQRRIANAARLTLVHSVLRDPRGEGWERVAGGGACRFCLDLAGRYFRSESSAEFRTHDSCHCAAEPVWR